MKGGLKMKSEKNRWGLTLTGAVIAAVAASLCCILPVIAVALGVAGFAASEFFARWRPYLLTVTFGLLALGFYLAYRPQREACEVGSLCESPSFVRWNRAILGLVTVLVLVLAAFPYYSGWVARAVTKEKKPAAALPLNSAAHVVLNVEGMDCPVCAALLQRNLGQIPGVRHVEVNFQKKRAILDYNARAVTPSRFISVIRDAGYKVTAASPPVN